MSRSATSFSFSDNLNMTTRGHSKEMSARLHHKESSAKISNPQQMPDFPTSAEEQCHRAAKCIAGVQAAVRNYLSRAEGSSDAMSDSHTRNQELNSEIERLTRSVARRDSMISQLETELEASKIETQNLRIKEQTLRDFVIESDPYQGISDGDVVSAFTRIRQKIQKLASSKILQLDEPLLDLKSSPFTIDEDHCTLWRVSTRSGRVLILRALLFRALARQVLEEDFFGITGFGEYQAKDSEIISDLSPGLSQFERALIHCNVPNDVVVNWRLSTLKSVEAAGMNKVPSGSALAEQLYGSFATFIAEGATQQDRAKLQHSFRELCSQAYALRLLMRKSRENYQCLSISSGELIEEWEHFAEVYGQTDDKVDGKVEVALTLCDCLVKYRSETEEHLVLEKAQVITTRQ